MALQTPISMFDDHEGHFFSYNAIDSIDASPALLLLWKAAWANGDFERFAYYALRRGFISSLDEALPYFNDICLSIPNPSLALCDLQGNNYHRYRVTKAVKGSFEPVSEDSDESNGYNHRFFGTISHALAWFLATGAVLKSNPEESLLLFDPNDYQLGQQTLLTCRKEILQRKKALRVYLRDVHGIWTAMCSKSGKTDWVDMDLLRQAREVLLPFLGYYVKQIKANQYCFQELQTLSIWAAWLLRCAKLNDPWYIFSEIPALDKRWGIPGGRIDAIRVVSIDGLTPNKEQVTRLLAMQKTTFQSVGWLVAALRAQFPGKKIVLQIIDWKFAIGDHPHNHKTIVPDEVIDRPFRGHRDQMKRYLTAVLFDIILVQNHLDGVNTNLSSLTMPGCQYLLEPHCELFDQGLLVYFFPNYPEPMCHRISMTSEEHLEHFQETVLSFPLAQEKAVIRNIYNQVGQILTGKGNGKIKVVKRPASTLNIFHTE